MIQAIQNFKIYNQVGVTCRKNKENLQNKYYTSAPFAYNDYNIGFKGMSLTTEYKKTSDFLSAVILRNNLKKYGVDGSTLSASNIADTIQRLFCQNRVYLPFTMADTSKIKWKSYIAQEVKDFCVNKVNDARIDRFNQWKSFLEQPLKYTDSTKDNEILTQIDKDDCLKFIIWNAINNDICVNNRHIPVPFNLEALSTTMTWFNSITPDCRKVQATSAEEFLEMYTHKLKDNLLMERPELILSQKYSPEANEYWIKIPSIKKDRQSREKNIYALEQLSNENWCTRSSVDKAEAALTDGDFYMFLRRDRKNNTWQSVLGMTTYQGKVDQIQGALNDNLIPQNEIENIKHLLQTQHLQCVSGLSDEGPKALQQILITEKINSTNNEFSTSLSNAFNRKNNYIIFKLLGEKAYYSSSPSQNVLIGRYNISICPTPLLELQDYKPTVILDAKKGITVPYSFLMKKDYDEDTLLQNVCKIKGDMVLCNKNHIYNSTITRFPRNLKEVGGKIICTKEQYERFKDNMLAVVKDSSQIVIKN